LEFSTVFKECKVSLQKSLYFSSFFFIACGKENETNLFSLLLDLQNPNTFTLGMDGGKKKITKASFMDNTSSLSDNMDTSDPLGSLCMWQRK
jgi:hypothetical protein